MKELIDIEVNKISPSPYQTRKEFDPAALKGLAENIEKNGLAQPILVRKVDDGYELIAGERRLKAIRDILEEEVISSIVMELDDQEAETLCISENLQRKSLNIVEQAEAFSSMLAHQGLNHAHLAEKLGVSRSVVTNTIRLLKLPEPVKDYLSKDKLNLSSGISLLQIKDKDDQVEVAEKMVKNKWTIDRLRSEVKKKATEKEPEQKSIVDTSEPKTENKHKLLICVDKIAETRKILRLLKEAAIDFDSYLDNEISEFIEQYSTEPTEQEESKQDEE